MANRPPDRRSRRIRPQRRKAPPPPSDDLLDAAPVDEAEAVPLSEGTIKAFQLPGFESDSGSDEEIAEAQPLSENTIRSFKLPDVSGDSANAIDAVPSDDAVDAIPSDNEIEEFDGDLLIGGSGEHSAPSGGRPVGAAPIPPPPPPAVPAEDIELDPVDAPATPKDYTPPPMPPQRSANLLSQAGLPVVRRSAEPPPPAMAEPIPAPPPGSPAWEAMPVPPAPDRGAGPDESDDDADETAESLSRMVPPTGGLPGMEAIDDDAIEPLPAPPDDGDSADGSENVYSPAQMADEIERQSAQRTRRIEVGSSYSVSDSLPVDEGESETAGAGPRRRGESTSFYSVADATESMEQAAGPGRKTETSSYSIADATESLDSAAAGPRNRESMSPYGGAASAADALAADDRAPSRTLPGPEADAPVADGEDDAPAGPPADRPRYGQPREPAGDAGEGSAAAAAAADMLAGALDDDAPPESPLTAGAADVLAGLDGDEDAADDAAAVKSETDDDGERDSGVPAPRPRYGQGDTGGADSAGPGEAPEAMSGAVDMLAGLDEASDDALPAAAPAVEPTATDDADTPAPRPTYGQAAGAADAAGPGEATEAMGGAADMLAGLDDDSSDDLAVAPPAGAIEPAGDDGGDTPAPRPTYGQAAAAAPDAAGMGEATEAMGGAADMLAGLDDDSDDDLAGAPPAVATEPAGDDGGDTPAPRPKYGQAAAAAPDAAGMGEATEAMGGAADVLAGLDDDSDDDLAGAPPAVATEPAGDDGGDTPAPRPKYGQATATAPDAAGMGEATEAMGGAADMLAGLDDDSDDGLSAPAPATAQAAAAGMDDDDDDLAFLSAAHTEAPDADPEDAAADDVGTPAPRPSYGQPRQPVTDSAGMGEATEAMGGAADMLAGLGDDSDDALPAATPAAAATAGTADADSDDDLAFLTAAHTEAPEGDAAADRDAATPAPRPSYGQPATAAAPAAPAVVPAADPAASDSDDLAFLTAAHNDAPEADAPVHRDAATPAPRPAYGQRPAAVTSATPAPPATDDGTDSDDDLAFLTAAHSDAPEADVSADVDATPAPRPTYGQRPAPAAEAAPPAASPAGATASDSDDELAFLTAAHSDAPDVDAPADRDAATPAPRPTYGRPPTPDTPAEPEAAPATGAGADSDDELAFLTAAHNDVPEAETGDADAPTPAPRPTYGRDPVPPTDPSGVPEPQDADGPDDDDELAFLMSAHDEAPDPDAVEDLPPDTPDALPADAESASRRLMRLRPSYAEMREQQVSDSGIRKPISESRLPARRPTYRAVDGVLGPEEVNVEAAGEAAIDELESPYGASFVDQLEQQLADLDGDVRQSTISEIMGSVTDAEIRAYARSRESDRPKTMRMERAKPTGEMRRQVNASLETGLPVADTPPAIANRRAPGAPPADDRETSTESTDAARISTDSADASRSGSTDTGVARPALEEATLLTHEEFKLGVQLRAGAVFDAWTERMDGGKTVPAEAVPPEVFRLLYGRLVARKRNPSS